MSQDVIRLDDGRLATPNLTPGKRVYDEHLITWGGRELRTWDPTRSKLAAYLLKGGREFAFREESRVLYLGAANGTTPSHVSDVCAKGLVVSVEFSPRSFRDLVGVSAARENMIPVLADAWKPETYARFAGAPEILYMDIAQRNQAQILVRNIEAFRPKVVYFMVKPRSIDVAADPREVVERAAVEVTDGTGYQVVDRVDLAPFEKDHACLVLAPGGQRRDPRAPAVRRDAPRRDFGGARREGRGPPRRDFSRGPPRGDRGGARGPPREGPRGGGFRKDFKRKDRR